MINEVYLVIESDGYSEDNVLFVYKDEEEAERLAKKYNEARGGPQYYYYVETVDFVE